MLETNCPECDEKGSLRYSTPAEISFVTEGNRLRPLLNINNIDFDENDGGYIFCKNCQKNSDDSDKLYDIKTQYDEHMIYKEDAIYQDTIVI